LLSNLRILQVITDLFLWKKTQAKCRKALQNNLDFIDDKDTIIANKCVFRKKSTGDKNILSVILSSNSQILIFQLQIGNAAFKEKNGFSKLRRHELRN
jgi:hypothetical protein